MLEKATGRGKSAALKVWFQWLSAGIRNVFFFSPLDNGGCANQRAKAQESLVELQGCRAALSLDVKLGGLDSGELQYTAEVSRT